MRGCEWTFREKHELFKVIYGIEDKMAEVDDRLDALEKSVDGMITRVSADLQALRDQLANTGKLTPQTTGHFDAIIGKLDAYDVTNPPPPPAVAEPVPPTNLSGATRATP